MTKRIDKTVAEPLLRMAISSLDSAWERINALNPVIDGAEVRKASKLSTAQKRMLEASTMLAEFAATNGIELRDTMAT